MEEESWVNKILSLLIKINFTLIKNMENISNFINNKNW